MKKYGHLAVVKPVYSEPRVVKRTSSPPPPPLSAIKTVKEMAKIPEETSRSHNVSTQTSMSSRDFRLNNPAGLRRMSLVLDKIDEDNSNDLAVDENGSKWYKSTQSDFTGIEKRGKSAALSIKMFDNTSISASNYTKFKEKQRMERFASKSTEQLGTTGDEKKADEPSSGPQRTRMPTQTATRRFKFISDDKSISDDLKSASESNLSFDLISQKKRESIATLGSIILEPMRTSSPKLKEDELKIDRISLQSDKLAVIKSDERKTTTTSKPAVDVVEVKKPANLNATTRAAINTVAKKAELKIMEKRVDDLLKMIKVEDNVVEDVSKLTAEPVPASEKAAEVPEAKAPEKGADNFANDFANISTLLSNNIGFSVAGGLFDIHLKRNTRLPCMNVKSYTTAFDYQRELILPLYTGERPLVKFCESLGKLRISKIPKVKAGEILIEVTFYVDEDEKLSLTAMDTSTKKPLPIQLELNPTFKSRDADMLMDALVNKKQDAKLVSLIKEFKSIIRDIRVRYDDFEIREEMNAYLNRMTKMEDVTQESIEKLTEQFYKRLIELGIKL